MNDVGKRVRNKGVLISIFIGLVPLVAATFGFTLPVEYNEIIYTILGILVALGIISNPKEGDYFEDEKDGNDE
jgi:uncharacterized membrane protein